MHERKKILAIVAVLIVLFIVIGLVQLKEIVSAEFTFIKSVEKTKVMIKLSWFFAIPPMVSKWLWNWRHRDCKNRRKKRN